MSRQRCKKRQAWPACLCYFFSQTKCWPHFTNSTKLYNLAAIAALNTILLKSKTLHKQCNIVLVAPTPSPFWSHSVSMTRKSSILEEEWKWRNQKGGLGKIGKRPGALPFHWTCQAVMPGSAASRPPPPPAAAADPPIPD